MSALGRKKKENLWDTFQKNTIGNSIFETSSWLPDVKNDNRPQNEPRGGGVRFDRFDPPSWCGFLLIHHWHALHLSILGSQK